MRRGFGIRFSLMAVMAAGLVLHLSAGSGSEECTTLVATGAATPSGGPLLWKNRDTGTLSNKVILVTEHPHSFLALIDADDTAGRAAWAGVNSVGFGIANSASYNLPQPAGELQEQEGVVMAEALRTLPHRRRPRGADQAPAGEAPRRPHQLLRHRRRRRRRDHRDPQPRLHAL